ncbi:MAG: PEP-CTERM sorting domain-containing protein [Akkermansiaceae bacterium]
MNVEIIQVRDDAGANATLLDPSGSGDGYLYQSQVNDIWSQAGIQVTFTNSTWDNTEALRLDSTERSAVYSNSFATGSGSPIPGIGVDTLQIFFVMDHPGTGYDGSAGSGWVGTPLADPSTSARNAGNAQLYISGTFASNGRAVMANEGFTADSLSGTITHEIGHALGLRHVEDVNGGAGAGTTQDPTFSIGTSTANLMWGAGNGPAYDGGLTLQENFNLTSDQIDAAIFNGLDLDPDGNGTGVLQAVPEPSSTFLMGLGGLALLVRRRS